MKSIQDSRLIAILALGVACFAAGFSMTATAYAHLSADEGAGAEMHETHAPRVERHCATH